MTAPDESPDEEEIFQVAVGLPIAERESYLRSACEGYPEVRTQVERLLAAIDDEAFMGRSADRTASPALDEELARLKPEQAGEKIGPYQLLEQIGEGGFGRVWVAEQEKPIRRRVALKIIKLGMDTREVIARFEQERQALALMDHPNIAKVFEAGATQHGRPFFVMELVKGVKITDYCDQANLSTKDRLHLFMLVCQAVQHAHQKGIIHRDLKPSNVLVTLHDGVAIPKVIDFGVAKATQQQRLTDLTIYTQLEQMIGTPLYMAPEQAELSGLDIDTRSDIYSLGALLYELLTGRTPFDPEKLFKAGYEEMRRVIREEEPQKPSKVISTMGLELRTTVAKHRSAEGTRLSSSIRGDLDWIVMKALEKDRNRRYETASELAKDIERHLTNEPVLARPPTRAYRFRRFVRRNKGIVSASVGIAAAVVLGSSLAMWQAVVAHKETARANATLEDLRATAPAFAEQARALVAQERFDEAIHKLDYAIKLRPDAGEYLLSRANLLESQLRLSEAASNYAQVLRLDPAHTRAAANLRLCEDLARQQKDVEKLPREALARLMSSMKSEARSPGEMMLVARLMGAEKNWLFAYWMERLKDLPIPPDRPLAERLAVEDVLSLDLSNTAVVDLAALAGMPLSHLNLTNCEKLADLSSLQSLPLKTLAVARTKVTDLSPIRGVAGLTELNLGGCKIVNLSPLSGLRGLKVLNLESTAVTDLSALKGSSLESLNIANTAVSDLTPLAGMPLRHLNCSSVPATDFSPLAGAPLETLLLENDNVRDLSFVTGMPLKALTLAGCKNVLGFGALLQIPSLEVLLLPNDVFALAEAEIRNIGALRKSPQLTQIQTGPAIGAAPTLKATPKEQFYSEFDRQLKTRNTLMQLSGGRGRFDLQDGGTWVASFQGLDLKDLAPLRGLPIEVLNINNTKVHDLTPLKGMNLSALYAAETLVTDISALKGMPLNVLNLHGCAEGIDLAPLAEIPTLEQVLLPRSPKNIDALRGLPKLARVSYEVDYASNQIAQTAAAFWNGKLPPELEARDFGEKGKFSEMIKPLREWAKTIALPQPWVALGVALVAGGDRPGYEAYCREIIERMRKYTGGSKVGTITYPETIVKICLLSPNPAVPLKELETIMDNHPVNRRDADPRRPKWHGLSEGILRWRMGDAERAVAILKPIGGDDRFRAAQAAANAILAMAYHQLRDNESAQAAFLAAKKAVADYWQKGAVDWWDFMVAELLANEAEELLSSESAAGNTR